MGTQVMSWDAAAADRAVAVLKAVADPSRYRLLWALSTQELPVSALAELLDAHVAATSQHLAKLRAAGLVESRREGTRIYYRAGARVRGLLEEASLVANTPAQQDAGESEAPAEPVAVAKEERVRAPRTVRARRPVVEH
ncbi:ArsR/SmtB family transcription factor [Streptomyces halobius]|uniref:Metalloregulator ArsR/SmtB family transcription factor n=1 Tax=Streptomyces halobius TaxID=2879846 RepID=A0ABY4LZ84_9ACTN|nr:metalloregulator ArsR/SmtB family transcription factor [Streptomyces halobius]UQA90814.1 metalloregulator ArsR/SmtB family transcription factor [Streptomyces halobius]